jgi:hypothetical protein
MPAESFRGLDRLLERMLLVRTSTMNRKALALTIVLLITGLAPATAIIGFCTRMPCCSHEAAAAVSFATESTDCCTTITCYESPSLKLTTGTSAAVAFIAAPVLLASVPVLPQRPVIARAVVDTSPPATSNHRLAVLSVFLI